MGNTYVEYEGIVALMSLENCADGCREIAVFSLFRHCFPLLYAAVFRRRSEPNQKLALAGCEIPLLTAAQRRPQRQSYCAAAAVARIARRNSGVSLRPCRNALMLRVACRKRWRFSTSAMRTNPSPYSPKPEPGETATLARSSSSFEKPRLPSLRNSSGIGAQANIVPPGAGMSQPA